MPGHRTSLSELFAIFLRLGLTSFGGPIAHIGYFHTEFVERRRWLSNEAFGDLVALCQFLPGPASSQVVIGIGLGRGGIPGALIASLGFTLPSALLMIGFGYGITSLGGGLGGAAWIHALKVVAVAVVAQALWAMARTLCPDRLRGTIALGAGALLVLWPGSTGQIIAILSGAALGWWLCNPSAPAQHSAMQLPLGRSTAIAMLLTFAVILGIALVPAPVADAQGFALFSAMFQSGALVFGGGHVLLPLLEAETVRTGWVNQDLFLAGYGAAQALPGPLFTFAAFLGTVQTPAPNGWVGGLIAAIGVFLPSYLLVFGALPFWFRLRGNPAARAALAGVNAAVVGLLAAAFYDPVFTGAIRDGADAALAMLAFALLALWKVPAWIVVIGAGGGAMLFNLI
jgi:chromate transporter